MNELSNRKENPDDVESEGSQLKIDVTIQNGIAATNHENTIGIIEDESNKITIRDIEEESKQVKKWNANRSWGRCYKHFWTPKS